MPPFKRHRTNIYFEYAYKIILDDYQRFRQGLENYIEIKWGKEHQFEIRKDPRLPSNKKRMLQQILDTDINISPYKIAKIVGISCSCVYTYKNKRK